jgi:lysozyme family protein
MANFALLIPVIFRWEGGYANDPRDRGGETYKGVARNAHPTWEGWKIVDAEKARMGGKLPKNYFIQNPALDAMVEGLAKRIYWDFFKADQIKSQEIAEIIVDWGWASGTVTAAKQVQRLLGVPDDGRFGEVTLKKLNAGNPEKMFNAIQQARIRFVENIVKNNPSQAVYLKGWKNRILGFQSPETRKRWLAVKLGGGLVVVLGIGFTLKNYLL